MSKIELTFERFMSQDYDDSADDIYTIYIVENAKDVLYVVMTKRNIFDRWFGFSGHMEAGSNPLYYSEIGKVIYHNMPESKLWTIKMLTTEDAFDLLGEKAPKISNINSSHAIRKVEHYLIKELHPLFNVSSQSRPHTEGEIELVRKYLERK